MDRLPPTATEKKIHMASAGRIAPRRIRMVYLTAMKRLNSRTVVRENNRNRRTSLVFGDGYSLTRVHRRQGSMSEAPGCDYARKHYFGGVHDLGKLTGPSEIQRLP